MSGQKKWLHDVNKLLLLITAKAYNRFFYTEFLPLQPLVSIYAIVKKFIRGFNLTMLYLFCHANVTIANTVEKTFLVGV